MESGDSILLQPIRHLTSVKDGENPKSQSTSVERLSKSSRPILPNSSTLIINLPDNSTTGIDRSPNVVQNFLSEITPKNQTLTWQNVVRNMSYIISWYFFSTALSFYNKALVGKDKFDLDIPLFVSAMHTGSHFLITSILRSGSFSCIYKKPEGKSVSINSYFVKVVPCAIAAALEICMANASLMYITLSFYTMVKSSTPIWVLIFAFMFGLENPRVLLVAIISVISIGVIMTVFGETALNITGFLLVLGAAIFSGLRWSLTQILLQQEESMNHPISTLYYISPVMFVAMVTLSLIFERPFEEFGYSKHFKNFETIIQTFGLMLLGGILAFCMTISEFALIKNTSTVTLSVAGISKEVVVIMLSVLIYQDKLTPLNILGLVVSIVGIAGYNYYRMNKNSQDNKGHVQELNDYAKTKLMANEDLDRPTAKEALRWLWDNYRDILRKELLEEVTMKES
ncbi:5125_t:CDS:2 [Dentiscutata erythropus]|uniref:5125_t:CDS:1 n=1 Tax=Dentiscutata erythropus TaxID=1348616 RepID=A0A9N9DSP0_9GLOM|nr:5125_t:CDS:2 [Dentiscutata erythropus]